MSADSNQRELYHTQDHNLILVSIGNESRGDDGIGPYIGRMVSERMSGQICFVNLGVFQSEIAGCVNGHRQIVVVDAMLGTGCTGASYTVALDMENMEHPGIVCRSSHGLTWLDELRLHTNNSFSLTFFGIQAGEASWSEGLSDEMRAMANSLSDELSALIVEKLGGDLCTKAP